MDRRDRLQAHVAAVQQPMHVRGRHARMVAGRLRWGAHLLVVTLVVGVLALVPCSQAADFACAAGDVACLLEAIHTANANGDANTITLAAGTYTLTAPATLGCSFGTCNGLPVITSPLTIIGGGADTTIIERGASASGFRILNVASSSTLTLQELTLRGGRSIFGGGISNGGTLTLVHTTVTDNSAVGLDGEGGGISNGGTLTLVHTTVTANQASTGKGGGISTSGTVTIVDSIIADNGGNFGGGGLYITDGIVTLIATTVTRNGGDGGGGILNSGTVRIIQSAITNNESVGFDAGGGISNTGTLSMENSTVDGNNVFGSGDGGGMVNFGTATVTNSTISHNGAHLLSGAGGGIANLGGTLTVTNSTVSHNFTTTGLGGGGILIDDGTVTLHNTILAQNTTSLAGPDCFGVLHSLGHNLLGNLTDCSLTLDATDRLGDPGLGDFTDDGTPGHGHFPLLPTSVAIDAGDPAACPPTDQLGQPRVDGNGDGQVQCDIGAIEFVPPENINALVRFEPLPDTFQTTAQTPGCPAGFVGQLQFQARLTPQSAEGPPLTDLHAVVTELTEGNLLQNADGGPGGVGATLRVPRLQDFADGVLRGQEFVDVSFVICLQTLARFTLFVDVLGVVTPTPDRPLVTEHNP